MDSKLFVCCYATFVPKIVNIIVLLLLFRFQPTSEKTFLVAVFFLPFFGFILYITGEFQSDIQLWERLHPFENLLCKRRVEMGFPSPNTKTKWKAANLPINSIFFLLDSIDMIFKYEWSEQWILVISQHQMYASGNWTFLSIYAENIVFFHSTSRRSRVFSLGLQKCSKFRKTFCVCKKKMEWRSIFLGKQKEVIKKKELPRHCNQQYYVSLRREKFVYYAVS